MAEGRPLRDLRKRRGLSLEAFGKLCGISGDELSRYERGEKSPREANTAKIAAALDLPLTCIRDGICWTGSERPHDPSALRSGLLRLLEETYGPVETGEYRDRHGGARQFWTFGPPPFTLYESDLSALEDAVSALALPLLERLRDTRPEAEVLREALAQAPKERAPEDLSDEQWAQVRDLLPDEKHGRGRAYKDNRLMLDGILYWLQTGVPWRELPERYGRFRCVYDRLRLWNASGVWPKVLARLLERGILEEGSIVVDSTHFK